jgi:hypothetical protein
LAYADPGGGGGGVLLPSVIVSVATGDHLPVRSRHCAWTRFVPVAAVPPYRVSVRFHETCMGCDGPGEEYAYVAQVTPSLESLSVSTPLMSSRPYACTVTVALDVLASTRLAVTVPVGAFRSTSAPFVTRKCVVPSLSTWLSREASPLLALSYILLSGSVTERRT